MSDIWPSSVDQGKDCLPVHIQTGDVDAARRLLEAGHDANIHINTNTYLLRFACQVGNSDMVALLLQYGAEPDMTDGSEGGMRPLHIAAYQGHADMVERLLSAGAEVNVLDDSGRTPLYRAVEEGHVDVVRLLVKHGADPDVECHLAWVSYPQSHFFHGQRPLMVAIEKRSSEMVQVLLESKKVDINYMQSGTSNLVMALTLQQRNIVELLLQAGADPNLTNRCGATALHYADHPDIVDLLLNYGANPEGGATKHCSSNQHGLTPLLKFIERSPNDSISAECAVRLIYRGCNVNIKYPGTGKTPLVAACENRRYDIVTLLIMVGSDVKDAITLLNSLAAENPNFSAFVRQWVYNPHPLLHICRVAIRNILQWPLKKKVMLLSLPAAIEKYILLEDIQKI